MRRLGRGKRKALQIQKENWEHKIISCMLILPKCFILSLAQHCHCLRSVCVCVCVCVRRDFRMYNLSILGVTLLLTDHIYAVLNFIDINTSKNVCISSEFNDKRKWSLYSICFIHNECKRGQIQSLSISLLFQSQYMTGIHFLSRNVMLNIDHSKPNKMLSGRD